MDYITKKIKIKCPYCKSNTGYTIDRTSLGINVRGCSFMALCGECSGVFRVCIEFSETKNIKIKGVK